MKFYRSRLLLAVIFKLVVVCYSNGSKENDTKVLIDYTGNIVNQRPGVKPTSAPVSHLPGVPPVIATPTKPTLIYEQPTTGKPINSNPFNWFASLFHHNVQREPGDEANGDFGIGGSNETYLSNTNSSMKLIANNVEFVDENNVTSIPVQSEALILKPNGNYSFGIFGPTPSGATEPNKGIFDWLLNIVGIQTGDQNKPMKPSPEHVKHCPKCSCGESFKDTRIVGGVITQVNAYPWMTILTYNGRFYCGASVINNKYLLTALHCVNDFPKERLKAVFLDHDRASTVETKTFTRRISGILKHSGYHAGGTYNNDIALLRLDEELPFNGLLRPVCLPTIGKSYTGYTGVVTGWGATEEHGQVSNKLREVHVPILSNIDCRKTGYGNKITDNMMCAGHKNGKKDSCQGDSGGPLHVVNKTLHTIVGIVSWGEGCADKDYPGVYTRVNRYMSWIKSNTKDACYCSPNY